MTGNAKNILLGLGLVAGGIVILSLFGVKGLILSIPVWLGILSVALGILILFRTRFRKGTQELIRFVVKTIRETV